MEQWSGNIEAEIETKDSIKENKKNQTEKSDTVQEYEYLNRRTENNVGSKVELGKCVLSIVWLIINVVALLFFATYSNSIADLFITLSLPLNMGMIVLCFSKSDLEAYDEFIK